MFLAPHDTAAVLRRHVFSAPSRATACRAFRDLLERVAAYYAEHASRTADRHGDSAGRRCSATCCLRRTAVREPFSRAPLRRRASALQRDFDGQLRRLRRARPSSRIPMNIEFLLRAWRATADDGEPDLQALYMATLTLTRMAEGGLYDQLGGGFCRYSVDPYWMIPHFEKMLYDNGQLLAVAARRRSPPASRCSGAWPRETADWMLRDMEHAGGRLLLDARRRFRRPRGQVLRLDAATRCRPCSMPDEYAVFARALRPRPRRRISRALAPARLRVHGRGRRRNSGSTRNAAERRARLGAREAARCPQRGGSGPAATRRSSPAGMGSRSRGSRRRRARSTRRGPRGRRRARRRLPARAVLARRPAARGAHGRRSRFPAYLDDYAFAGLGTAGTAAGALARRGSRGRSSSPRRCSRTSRTRTPADSFSPPTTTSTDPAAQDLHRRRHALRQRRRGARAGAARIPARGTALSRRRRAHIARGLAGARDISARPHVSLLMALDEFIAPPDIVVLRGARGRPGHLAHGTRQGLGPAPGRARSRRTRPACRPDWPQEAAGRRSPTSAAA